jgi:hypothetical protein
MWVTVGRKGSKGVSMGKNAGTEFVDSVFGRDRAEGGKRGGSIAPSKRISKSPIGTSNNIGKGSGQRGTPGSKTSPHRLKLTNRWERGGRPTVRLTEHSRSRGEQR